MLRLASLTILVAGCSVGFYGPAPAPARDLAGVDLVSAVSDLGGAVEITLATGSFAKGQQSGGDTGSGAASLVRRADGSEELRLGADFSATPVPAPEVVLTTRAAIGAGGIDTTRDLDLGPLGAATGAQHYALPGSDGGRRNLFVYCVTYGIDVAVARLR